MKKHNYSHCEIHPSLIMGALGLYNTAIKVKHQEMYMELDKQNNQLVFMYI